MQAILMTQVGGPEVLELQEIDEPNITEPSQVKIKLFAAGINPVDTKLRKAGLFYDQALPAVLGCDGAGEIISVGRSVTGFKPGDSVWFCHGGLGKEQGNYAEFTVIDQRWIARMPATASYVEAAAAPLVLITAWGALYDRGGLQGGQTVLIHAGAGGVGHVAIQLAKLKGARVIATVGSDEKADFVRSLGADEVINYKQLGFANEVNRLTENKGVDLVFDTVGAEVFKASIDATCHFGRIVTLLDPGEVDLSEARMRNLLIGFELMLTPMLRELNAERDKHVRLLSQCAEYIDSGDLKIVVAHQFKMSEVQAAHQLLEQGHMQGKSVLTFCG
jgi:NADPH2:quinone reductase